MSNPFIGEIILFAGNFAPRGWAFCQGQLLSIAQNTALFAIVGTTYGGDGRTNFGLPDLRGRTAMGNGNGPGLTPRRLGEKSGAETVTLTPSTAPPHNHQVTTSHSFGASTANANSHQPTTATPLGTPTIQGNPGIPIYSSSPADTAIEGAAIGGNLVLADAGGSQAHENMAPFLTMNYIIALQGVFPSRS